MPKAQGRAVSLKKGNQAGQGQTGRKEKLCFQAFILGAKLRKHEFLDLGAVVADTTAHLGGGHHAPRVPCDTSSATK